MNLRGINLSGSWEPREVREIVKILAPLPPALVEDNPSFTTIIRRAVLADGPPEAPGHSKYEPSHGVIVVYDKGVYDGDKLDPEQFRRSVYHELAHSVLRSQPKLIETWRHSTSDDDHVDEYAKTSPEEDFCDSFSEVLIDPNGTKRDIPRKAEFIARLLEDRQQEKTAMHMLEGFADEITKTAAGGIKGMLAKAMGRGGAAAAKGAARGGARTPGKMSVGKGLALAGGAGGVGALAGAKKGKAEGLEEGRGDTYSVAQRARLIGRREGVMAYHRAMMQRMRTGQGSAAEK